MSILVVYGSKRGGTEGLATMLADALRQEGLVVEVLPAGAMPSVTGRDAVVIGGALYASRWHRAARRFVRRRADDLRVRPTYFFSSGPLDESATSRDIPPVKGVRALMDKVGARSHATFGGRLVPDAKGFPASAMAKKNAGDWRDPQHVKTWAHTITTDLHARSHPSA